jgi:hypothetical protein
MTTREATPSLDDVLNEFVIDHDQPTREALQTWIGRYPQYRRELVDFAAAWAEQRALPPAAELSAEEENSVANRAMSEVQNVLYARDARTDGAARGADEAPFAGLVAEARKVGFTPRELAQACRLDLALLTKLNTRQICPGSIPMSLIQRLAQLLRHPADRITAYLFGPPQAAAGMAFLARGKPQSAEQQSFAEAVQSSSLSSEEKGRWLTEAAGLDNET